MISFKRIQNNKFSFKNLLLEIQCGNGMKTLHEDILTMVAKWQKNETEVLQKHNYNGEL